MKNVYRATRRLITLMEIMIVMALIAMILGVVAYNYQGALESGRIFETEGNINKIKSILTLKIAQHPEAIDNLSDKWKDYVKESPLVQNPDKVIRDGWGQEYRVSVEDTPEGPVIVVYSTKLQSARR